MKSQSILVVCMPVGISSWIRVMAGCMQAHGGPVHRNRNLYTHGCRNFDQVEIVWTARCSC